MPTRAGPLAHGLKALAFALLFFLGLTVGGLVLTPWQQVWTMALARADKALGKADFEWKNLVSSGPLGFDLEEVRIKDKSGKPVAGLRKVGVHLGLIPLALKLRLDTGRELMVTAYRSGRMVLRGEVDLDSLLDRRDVGGIIQLDGDLGTRKWRTPPINGRIEAHAKEVALPGDIRALGAVALVEIRGAEVTLRSFSVLGPVPIKAHGSAQVNWNNLKATTYNVSGEITFGTKPTPFDYKGNLGGISWLPL